MRRRSLADFLVHTRDHAVCSRFRVQLGLRRIVGLDDWLGGGLILYRDDICHFIRGFGGVGRRCVTLGVDLGHVRLDSLILGLDRIVAHVGDRFGNRLHRRSGEVLSHFRRQRFDGGQDAGDLVFGFPPTRQTGIRRWRRWRQIGIGFRRRGVATTDRAFQHAFLTGMLDLDDQLDRLGFAGLTRLGRHQGIEEKRAFGLASRGDIIAMDRQRLTGSAGPSFKEIARNVGPAETVHADIMHKGGERIPLATRERAGNAVIDDFLGAHDVIDEQKCCFILGHFHARLGGRAVAIANHPAAILTLDGLSSERLEPLDQVAGSRRSFQSRFHACSVSGQRVKECLDLCKPDAGALFTPRIKHIGRIKSREWRQKTTPGPAADQIDFVIEHGRAASGSRSGQHRFLAPGGVARLPGDMRLKRFARIRAPATEKMDTPIQHRHRSA